ncbi:hypothetical protein FKM82_017080 [Ascaphus truei]
MVIHYNKILTAKAAVDSSVPRSMLRSIKYGDQQRREKMRREVNRFERESSQSPSVSRPNSRERSDYTSPKKGFYEGPCNNIRGSPFSDPGQLYSTNTFISSPRQLEFLENNPELWKGASRRWPESSRIASRRQCEISDSSSVVSIPKSFSRFQDSQQKTYSRDLLDKHSEQFTNKHRPFTPRTLKTEAKSVLAQYRYYTAPRRRRKDEMTEAETQTEDISSFLDEVTASEKRESPWLREKDGDAGDAQLVNDSEDKNQTDWHKLTTHHSFARVSSSNELKSPSPIMQKIKSEEEELVYLTFITDVTNEILALGLFSNRVLERVFERHFEENKLRLDEKVQYGVLCLMTTQRVLGPKSCQCYQVSRESLAPRSCKFMLYRMNGYRAQTFGILMCVAIHHSIPRYVHDYRTVSTELGGGSGRYLFKSP